MSVRDPGERAVSELLGSILLFALVVAALALVQANAVPAANKEVEFDHNQELHGDLLRFDADVDSVAATGTTRSTVIDTGLTYPNRFLLFNPSPATGTVATSPASFTVENAVAAGESADFWNGTARTYDSNRLVYDPAYNYYDAPTTVYEHGVVVNRFDGATRQVDTSVFVDGRSVTLVAVEGSYAAASLRASEVSTEPLSTDTRPVRVTDDGAPVRIVLETALSVDEWRSLLDEQRVDAGGHVQAVTPGPRDDTVVVTLEPGVTYRLSLAEVGVGGRTDRDPAAYLTTERATRTATVGTPVEVPVSALDQFNAPRTGVTLSATASGGTVDATVETGDDGVGVVTYTPTTAGTHEVTVRADLDGDGTVADHERVRVRVDATAQPGSSGGGGSGGGGTTVGTGGQDSWSRGSNATLSTYGGRWTGVEAVESILLSDPLFTSLKGGDGQVDTDKEYLRLTMEIRTDTQRYLLVVGDDNDGLVRKLDGDWEKRKVTLYRLSGSQYRKLDEAKLKASALEAYYQGTAPLDLLDESNYEDRFQRLGQLRQDMLTSTDTSIYFSEVAGRTEIRLD